MSLISANNPRRPKKKKAKLDERLCLGCGVCVRTCERDGIRLAARPERVITPVDSARRTVMMAIERGKLQNLIFDNQALASHRAMAAVLGVILKAPPVKQTLASRQMKSIYVDRLLADQR
jgi:ferredoxin